MFAHHASVEELPMAPKFRPLTYKPKFDWIRASQKINEYDGLNEFEMKIASSLAARGWYVHRCGWPDFLCTKFNGAKIEYCAVEAKQGTDRLSDRQIVMAATLESIGIPVYVVRSAPDVTKATDNHWNHYVYTKPNVYEQHKVQAHREFDEEYWIG